MSLALAALATAPVAASSHRRSSDRYLSDRALSHPARGQGGGKRRVLVTFELRLRDPGLRRARARRDAIAPAPNAADRARLSKASHEAYKTYFWTQQRRRVEAFRSLDIP